MFKEALIILFTILGSGGFISFLAILMKNVIINTLTEKIKANYSLVLEEIKKNHTKEIENYKLSLLKYTHYSDEQFRLYNDLWSSLCDLKESADALWESADKKNLVLFASQLKISRTMIQKSRLLLEEVHYEKLIRIINIFANFSLGKQKLIQLSERNNLTSNFLQPYINELIDSNGVIKRNYSDLLLDLSKLFKSQIHYTNINNF